MKKTFYLALLFFCLCVLILLGGCWSRVELENRGIVIAMAVDKSGQGELLEVTVQFVKPGEIKSGGGGEEGGGGGSSQAVVIYSATGQNMFEALNNISRKSRYKPYLGEMAVLLLGEEMARDNIGSIMDWVIRNREPRLRAMPLVVRGKPAKEVLITNIPTGQTWGLELGQMITNGNLQAKTVDIDILHYMQAVESITTNPVLAGIDLVGTGQEDDPQETQAAPVQKPVLSATAVFKDYKLVSWLDEMQTRGLLWVQGEVKGGAMTIPSSRHHNKYFAVEIARVRSEIKPRLEGDQITMEVKIKVNSLLNEITPGPIYVNDPAVIAGLEEEQQEAITREILMTLEQAQELGTDVFGFGEALRRSNPREWPRYEKRWDELFPTLELALDVRATIRRIGMTGNPVRSEHH